MRYLALLPLLFFTYSCDEIDQEKNSLNIQADTSKIQEVLTNGPLLAPNPFTYEGEEYEVKSVKTSIVVETDSMYSTLITLEPTKSLAVSIELKYYLYEGKHNSTDWKNTSDSTYVEVIFNELFYGERISYTTNMPPEIPVEYGSPGGTIEISNYNGKTWDVHFGAGGENLEEKAAGHYGRCGTGYLKGIWLD